MMFGFWFWKKLKEDTAIRTQLEMLTVVFTTAPVCGEIQSC